MKLIFIIVLFKMIVEIRDWLKSKLVKFVWNNILQPLFLMRATWRSLNVNHQDSTGWSPIHNATLQLSVVFSFETELGQGY